MKMFFFKGLPASGKSTKRALMLADPALSPIFYTNKDEIRRTLLNGAPWNKKAEKEVERLESEGIETLCKSSANIIVDNTHGHPKHEKRYREIATRHAYEFELVVFDTPLDECIRRDKGREHSVGEEVIRRMYRQFFVEPYVADPSLPTALIVDLDGTLAEATDRGWYDFDKCFTDRVVQPVRKLIAGMLQSGAVEHVLYVTGRDGRCRAATEAWLLEKAGFDPLFLFMKTPGDNRPDTITKHETFDQHIKPHFGVLFVLEDRKRIVEMWRELGLTCFQVAEKDD